MPSDEMQRLWQSQPAEAGPVDLEQLRRKAGKLHGTIRARNFREYGAVAVAAALFGWWALHAHDPLLRAAYLFLIAGSLFGMWYLWRHGWTRPLPEEFGLTDAFAFQCKALARQRDLLRGVVRWYLAPMLPGWALIVVYIALSGSWRAAVLVTVVFAAVFVLVWCLNRRAADRLDKQIEELFR